MIPETYINKYIIDRVDINNQTFYLKNQTDTDLGFEIPFKIRLNGIVNDLPIFVDTTHSSEDYLIYRFINPYLNAQSDIFKIKEEDDGHAIGYIFSSYSLIDDDAEANEPFNEFKQAYKFYCIKNIISQHSWPDDLNIQTISFSEIIESDSSYLVIHKPSVGNKFKFIEDYYPCLAIYGYFHYPLKANPQIVSFVKKDSDNSELENIIIARYHVHRKKQSIKLRSSHSLMAESHIAKLFYSQLLVEGDNPLYRFLVSYQIIEYLIDREFKKGIDDIIEIKSELTNFKFIQKINELYTPRTTIKKLFDKINFDDKNEIGNLLKSFLLEFIKDYDKIHIGDCFYDIRNLLFHDYKTVLEKNPDGSLTSLVIQCELLIHHLVVSLVSKAKDKKENQLKLNLY